MSSVQQKLFKYKISESGAVVGQEEMTGLFFEKFPLFQHLDGVSIPVRDVLSISFRKP